MVQLTILSGQRAGASHAVRRFPCSIGRAATADLRLDDAGVWDQHLQLDLREDEGFCLRLQTGALATVNGQPLQAARLRNGDVIELGAVKLQFWLGRVGQRSAAQTERLVWLALGAVTVGQLLLMVWLAG